MAKIPLNSVRWLTLREIAHMWSEEAGIPESIMLRELRLGVLNIPRLRVGQDLLDMPPPDEELPDPDERVDRGWLMEFCGKQEGWDKPEFWFGIDHAGAQGASFAGRPSRRKAIVQELERRAKGGELEDTLAEQARQLVVWADERFPGEQTPRQSGMENAIRKAYRSLKRDQK